MRTRTLGTQGDKQTWQGMEWVTGHSVVLKATPVRHLRESAIPRLMRETEALRKVHSPWMPPPLHCEQDGEAFFQVLPFVPGETLASHLARGRLSLESTLNVARCLLSALAAAHEQGLLNLGLKPTNVIVAPEPGLLPEAKLLHSGPSFGDLREEALQHVPTTALPYLAPEQTGLLEAEVGPAADLYAVGAVLFECLTGVPRFQGSSLGELLREHLSAFPGLRAAGVPVPRALEELIHHLLRKEPRARYQSAAAALADVEALASALNQGEQEPALIIGLAEPRRVIIEPAFIERGLEVAPLESLMERTARGQGGLLFIEGASGGGKTMLLDEVFRRSVPRGFRVFRGQGTSQAARQPFQLFRGIIQGVQSAAQAEPALVESLRAELSEHGDALGEVFPQLGVGKPEGSARRSSAPEGLKVVLAARALAALLDALGKQARPALILLDDCCWADEQTLQVLSEWQRADASRGTRFVSVVAAFRDTDVAQGHPLRRLEPETRITLPPFSPAEIHRLVSSMAGRLPEEAVEAVVQVAEGNPFLAAAVVRGLVESGALRPQAEGWDVAPERLSFVSSSRQAAAILLYRLQHLPEAARRLLAVGAVLGRQFEPALCALLAEQPLEQATLSLEEARKRHLVWRGNDGRYTFMHDRVRETLLEQLSPEELRALHGTAARELERTSPDDAFELAWHFDAAGQPERALPHALKAARQARRQNAPELAEYHYRIAERGAAGADPATRRAIAEELGYTLMVRGMYDDAEPRLQQALALAETPLDKALIETRLCEISARCWDRQGSPIANLGRALRLLGHWVPANAFTLLLATLWEVLVQIGHAMHLGQPRRALETESATLARDLYHRLSIAYWLQGNSPLFATWANLRELNLSERSGNPQDLARAYTTHAAMLHLLLPGILPRIGFLLSFLCVKRGRRYFDEGMRLFHRFGEPWREGLALLAYGIGLLYSARYTESLEHLRKAEEILLRAGYWEHTILARWRRGLVHYLLGDLSEAEEIGRQLTSDVRTLEQPRLRILGLHVLALATQGNVPDELLTSELTRPDITLLHQALTHLAEGLRWLRSGEPGRAVDAFSRAYQEESGVVLTRKISLLWLATALRQQALQVPPHAAARRASLLRQARTTVRRALWWPGARFNNHVHALRERGWLAALDGREALARRSFDRSLALAERLGMKYERVQTLQARAEVGAWLGWTDAATDAAEAQESLRKLRGDASAGKSSVPPVSLSLVDRFPRVLKAGRRIASALTRESVFTALREAVMELLRAERFELLEVPLDEGGEEPYRTGARRALEVGRAVVLPAEQLEALSRTGIRSLLCAPILVRGQAVACFCASHRQLTGLFDEEAVRISEFLASLTGAALENAQGFAEIQALSEERARLYHQAQEALRKRDEFLAVASHELRTPLTPLKLQLQGLLRGMRQPAAALSPEQWATKLELANARVQRFSRLVEDLFDLSRLTCGKLSLHLGEVNLSSLVMEVLERWRDELVRVKCEWTVRTPGPVIGHWDALRLEQVIENLLSNAMKYGPGRPIHISVERDGDRVRLQVRDFGMGIAPEDQARIFERFERAVSEDNYGGFGLGLWICREVAHALGGHISVQSAPGQGATFTVQLPGVLSAQAA